jgi:transposase
VISSPGRISKMGDGSVRTALYEAAHVILTRPIKGGALKSWAMKRAGMMKAKVTLARPRPHRRHATDETRRAPPVEVGRGTPPAKTRA